jgi:hypothetical protein
MEKLQNIVKARRRTGPKTSAGKARSAHNAFRHGLSLPVSADDGHSEDVDELASAIAGGKSDGLRYQYARRIAAAQLDLAQVRRARRDALSDGGGGHASAVGYLKLVKRLAALDRYERRALARRRVAIRLFDLVREE